MTLEEFDQEIHAQQRRLLTSASMSKQDVDRLRTDVDKRVRSLQAQRRALVKKLDESAYIDKRRGGGSGSCAIAA